MKSGLAYGGLPNCILKETSQSLQLPFALSSDTLRVFLFLSEDQPSGVVKNLLSDHFRKCIKARGGGGGGGGGSRLNRLFGQASFHFSPAPSPTV